MDCLYINILTSIILPFIKKLTHKMGPYHIYKQKKLKIKISYQVKKNWDYFYSLEKLLTKNFQLWFLNIFFLWTIFTYYKLYFKIHIKYFSENKRKIRSVL